MLFTWRSSSKNKKNRKTNSKAFKFKKIVFRYN